MQGHHKPITRYQMERFHVIRIIFEVWNLSHRIGFEAEDPMLHSSER